MKTSNKILLTALIVVLAGITTLITAASISIHRNTIEGNGQEVTKTWNLPDFSGVVVSGNFKVNITQDSRQEVTVTADENLHQYIITEVKDEQLHIYANKKISGRENLVIDINTPEINNIDASAGANINTMNTFKTDKLDINSSSGSWIKGAFEAGKITGNVSSGAHMELKGRSDQLSLKASSGGLAKAEGLQSGEVSVNGSAGAVLNINAIEALDVDVSSGAVVRYKGNPSMRKIDISSGGSLSKY